MASKVTVMPLAAPQDAAQPGEPSTPMGKLIARSRAAQVSWARLPLAERLAVLRRTRHMLSANAQTLARAFTQALPAGMQRNVADTLVAEVLPLAEACRFLERESATLLKCKRLGRRGRPIWLRSVAAEVHRVPHGLVLLIAPSNYPLLLPGVQALQALAAGNAVLWKPASGAAAAVRTLSHLLAAAGLPGDLLQVLEDTQDSGSEAMRAGVDKVFLTGHADTGRAVMHQLAKTLTPSVMELSGCDAVFLLPGADLDRAAEALAFGMRLNGSATCMAPRRVFASKAITGQLLPRLLAKLNTIAAVQLEPKLRTLLDSLLRDAEQRGAVLARDGRQGSFAASPTVVLGGSPASLIMQTDIFAPVMTFCFAETAETALQAAAQCPYALSASIFGAEQEATELARDLRVGTVLINDIIVSTADPRVAFGGRGASGFGVTRGREGLLEMTAVKTILRQRSGSLRPYARTGARHEDFFTAFIQALHGGSLRIRYQGLRRLLSSARKLGDE